jgi:CDP-glucose 4,6-dehydratase
MPRKFWQNRNVFVTGGTGLLGSWLVEELVRRGANVVGLVRDLVPRARLNWSGTVDRIIVVRGPVEDYPLLERTLNEYEIETVFHLAAQTIVGTANRNPVSTFETNIQGTWNLLEACRRNPLVKQIVVASSDKAYGEQAKLPYDESTPLEGRHPYDVSKSCVDLLCQAYFRTFKTPVCVTRCGNFYGGGDLNFNRIVPGTIRSVLFSEAPVIRSDGTLIRDYFYIEDAVGAYLMLAEKMADLSINGEAYNFSNEIQVTVLDLTKKILKLMKSNLKPLILDQASHEIPHQYLSAKKARRQLGWKPLFTLEQGLARTIRWYREFFKEVPMTRPR